MKCLLLIPLTVLFAACSSAQQANPKKVAAEYTAEANLPKGWPTPGPFNKVTLKSYPAYRAAFTKAGGQTFAFFRLFRHIKSQNIPMTAPVEMSLDTTKDSLPITSMGFLYQNQDVGKVGSDTQKVVVKDIPVAKALSYTFMGKQSEKNIATAKAAIEAELKTRKLSTKQYRLLGYNGPNTPKAKKTWELQALLEN